MGTAPWRVLNLDIEGLDHRVLKNLQLEVLRPDVVAVESFLPSDVHDWHKVAWFACKSPLVATMDARGYSLQSICGPTLVFTRQVSRK